MLAQSAQFELKTAELFVESLDNPGSREAAERNARNVKTYEQFLMILNTIQHGDFEKNQDLLFAPSELKLTIKSIE